MQWLTFSMGVLSFIDALKNTYKLQPAALQYMGSITALPWTPKIGYGIITDTFPICGSTKKSYIILLGMLYCLSALAYAFFRFESHGPVVAIFTVNMFSLAAGDVAVDGLMICQQRLDPKYGSEDLQAYIWGVGGIAGVIGYLLGGVLV